jgi:transposase
MTRYTPPRRLTPEQEAVVLERRRLWRVCTLKHLAHEFGVSITTIRRTERLHREQQASTSFRPARDSDT